MVNTLHVFFKQRYMFVRAVVINYTFNADGDTELLSDNM